jgi:hypothetical protein
MLASDRTRLLKIEKTFPGNIKLLFKPTLLLFQDRTFIRLPEACHLATRLLYPSGNLPPLLGIISSYMQLTHT